MDIHELRGEIDKIADELVKLFTQRMDVAAQIADYKKEHIFRFLYRPGNGKNWRMSLKKLVPRWPIIPAFSIPCSLS